MIIKSIELCNFRNYERAEFEFHQGTNVLYGDNAQGKTNVLEAIFVGGTTKSHKGSKDLEMIRSGEKEAHIRYHVEKRQRTFKVEVHMRKGSSKGIAIDGLPIKNSNELLGLSNIVFFSPEDLSIIKDGPEERRRFIDMELCQLNKAYLFYLTQYKKVLKQRNSLLKQIQEKPDLKSTLEIWNSQLAEHGKKIIEIREDFIKNLNEIMKRKHESLTGATEEIDVAYQPNCRQQDLENQLFLEEERDIYLGTTTIGPHRDDMIFITEDKDLRKYGSQGQKRTAALSLKMAEIEIVESTVGEKPILLLDDVLSELDRNRQNYLLENIKGIQTIITCTGLEEFVKNGINIDRTFEIINGTSKWRNLNG
ncbi:MAG: DNA replication/repair protein RecF [Lachnospiraceae bacterium]|nr:DNA replication/repair protein RecF [Lachnospiraceae bacterium]